MRALFINENIGGHRTVHRHLRDTITAHHDVVADFVDVPVRTGPRRAAGARIPGLAALDLDLQPLRAQLATSAWVRRRLADRVDSYDVLHVYTQNAALLSASQLAAVPSVVSTDTTGLHNAFRIPTRRPTRFTPAVARLAVPIERRVFDAADRVVANSDWAARSLAESYGVDEAKLRVFPFGIVAPSFTGAAPGTIETDPPTIVFVGHQLERKGGLRLLRIHHQHLAGRARLVMVSTDPVPRSRDVTVVDDITVGDTRLWDLLRASSIFVFPSTIDQAPNAVIEAMAAGLPVIAMKTAAIPEMVADGVSGVLVDPTATDDQLRSAIDRLLESPDTRSRMGAAGRKRFEERFDAEVSTAALVSVLREVAT